MDRLQELKTIYKALDDKLGDDIVVLDISKISSLTSYFVIASANNVNQIEAMCDNVSLELDKIGDYPIVKEGIGTAWALLDLGFCYIHIFQKETRETYNLETLWADADVIEKKLLENN